MTINAPFIVVSSVFLCQNTQTKPIYVKLDQLFQMSSDGFCSPPDSRCVIFALTASPICISPTVTYPTLSSAHKIGTGPRSQPRRSIQSTPKCGLTCRHTHPNPLWEKSSVHVFHVTLPNEMFPPASALSRRCFHCSLVDICDPSVRAIAFQGAGGGV